MGIIIDSIGQAFIRLGKLLIHPTTMNDSNLALEEESSIDLTSMNWTLKYEGDLCIKYEREGVDDWGETYYEFIEFVRSLNIYNWSVISYKMYPYQTDKEYFELSEAEIGIIFAKLHELNNLVA